MMKNSYDVLFGVDGKLAAQMDSYEFRQGQLDMAVAVGKAIEDGAHLVVEAGTGIGKSFAYLVPFIEWSVDQNKRVVISTYSKALQEQLARRDLPFLKKVIGSDFQYALCFGGENYLCLRRMERCLQQGLFETKIEAAELERIVKWAASTESGLRLDLDFEPSDKIWFRVCRQSDLCRGKRCPNRDRCFFNAARLFQSKSHLLIANHHLFFADIASSRQILPEYNAVVFDEAHNLEEVAAAHLGFELSNTQLNYLMDEFFHPRHNLGFLKRVKELKKVDGLVVLSNAVRQAGEIFFDKVLRALNGRSVQSLQNVDPIENSLSSTIRQMSEAVSDKLGEIKDGEEREDVAAHLLRLNGYASLIEEFVEQKRERHIYWVEAKELIRSIKCSLCVSPLDVAPYLSELVFDRISPIVFTSATLTVNNDFGFVKERWGLVSSRDLTLSSPFDYKRQTILYAPDDMPDPVREEKMFIEAISDRIEELVRITSGRTFVLFTSYQMLGRVHEILKERLGEFELLKHGDMPRWRMLEHFKKNENVVLFGTATFWQGVDVPGSALENVVITRLPFAVPDHPLIEARINDLKEKGRDAFMDYQVPRAVLLFRQGFGRLIRHCNDTGIVAVLDSRVKTRRYGDAFLNSIPQCMQIDDLDLLGRAYEKLKKDHVRSLSKDL